jgi:hypothetical protein
VLATLQIGFLISLSFEPEDGGDMFSPMTFNRIHGVISQKKVPFRKMYFLTAWLPLCARIVMLKKP